MAVDNNEQIKAFLAKHQQSLMNQSASNNVLSITGNAVPYLQQANAADVAAAIGLQKVASATSPSAPTLQGQPENDGPENDNRPKLG